MTGLETIKSKEDLFGRCKLERLEVQQIKEELEVLEILKIMKNYFIEHGFIWFNKKEYDKVLKWLETKYENKN